MDALPPNTMLMSAKLPTNFTQLKRDEQLLICVNAGIAYTQANFAKLDTYMQAVFKIATTYGIEKPILQLRVLCGDVLFNGNEIRNEAMHELVNSGVIAKSELETEYQAHLAKMGSIFNEALFRMSETDIKLFDELTRSTFIEHAAMLMQGASELRQELTGSSKLNPSKLVTSFAKYLTDAELEFAKNFSEAS